MPTARKRIAGQRQLTRRPDRRSRIARSIRRRRARARRNAPIDHQVRPRRDWSQFVTSTVALGALIFTGLSLQQTRAQNDIAEQGQITTRFSTAIDELGSTAPDVRLGGIYGLERIMRDSAADQPTVVEVLSAFVRNDAPGAGTPTTTPTTRPAPPTDVAAALTVLARRDRAKDKTAFEDLRGVNLADLDLSATRLADADLDNAILTGANLYDADLTGASLDNAHLESANMTGALMTGAYLESADLTGAHLAADPGLHLFSAHRGANLTGAYLIGAKLANADLIGVNLKQADLENADLTGANVTSDDLAGAMLMDVNLSGTSLCDGRTPPQVGYTCN